MLKKSILSIISCFLVLTTILGGCSKNGGKDAGIVNNYEGKGTHITKISETENYLVKDSATDYKILLPSEPKDYERYSAELLNKYYNLSTGINFEIVYDRDVNDSDTGKYISLGDTSLARKSGVSVSVDKFGSSGYRIFTKDDDVYITGSRSQLREGTYYGTLEFLEHTIDWAFYAMDEIQYSVLSDIKFLNFDITEIPEFDNRRLRVKNLTDSYEYQRFLTLNIAEEERLPFSGHSHFEVLNQNVYAPEHPDWYIWKDGTDYTHEDAFKNGQLCIGNEEMRKEFVSQLVKYFNDNPEITFVHLGQQDNEIYCTGKYPNGEDKPCQCAEWLEETNYSGALVKFTNLVAREVTEIIQKTQPDRHLQFEMFAYLASMSPPARLENGVWVADSEDVIPDDNVIVQFTPLGANASQTIDHEANKTYYNYLLGWKSLTENISTWLYDVNFKTNVISHKNWDTLLHDMRVFSEHGVTRYYLQNMPHRIVPQMIEMRLWVESKLMWNVSLDYNTLAHEFIENYYGSAAPFVKQAFDAMTTYYEDLRANKGVSGTVFVNLNKKELWSFGYVESIRQLFEQGFAAIKKIQYSDSTAYEKYYWRLCGAYIENMFMQMEYYRADYGKEYCLETINIFEKTVDRMGLTTLDEYSDSYASYIAKWRATYA